MNAPAPRPIDLDAHALVAQIRELARDAGFQRMGISGIELGEDEAHLRSWLAEGLYGTMEWMARHGDRRARPAELVPGTLRVISVGLDYGPDDHEDSWRTLADGSRAYVARYALGRDYHKLMRNRLQKLAERVAAEAETDTQREVAERLGITAQAVSQRLDAALWHEELRLHPLAARLLTEAEGAS